MPSSPRAIALLWCVSMLPLACSPQEPLTPPSTAQPIPMVSPDAHAHGHAIAVMRAGVAIRPIADDLARLDLDANTRTVGLLLDGDLAQPLRYRTQHADLTWSDWAEVELTWSEGALHVGRVALPEDTLAIALRGGQSLHTITALPSAHTIDPDAPLARELPVAGADTASPAHELRTARGALTDLVIPREQWGAREPERICNDVVAPYRLTIHHTAEPDSDGPDPAARMRQMQAVHIDTRMWCDFGYHFVISQSGLIYEGRRGVDRPAAHVGDQNEGNIGISLIGNFEVSAPAQPQLDALVTLMRRVRQLYPAIPWDRDAIRGHQQWPGQSTACPGSNLRALLDGLVSRTATDSDELSVYEGLTLQTRLIGDTLTDRHLQGTSQGVLDALRDDTFQAEVLLTNRTELALDNVTLTLKLDGTSINSASAIGASVEATSYELQSDAPALDGQSWEILQSDGALRASALTRALTSTQGHNLDLGAIAPGESRRVVLELTAVGVAGSWDHTNLLRAWVKDIPTLYEGQTAWDAMPRHNLIGRLLQSQQRVDALSRDAWRWINNDRDDLQGWRAINATLMREDGGISGVTQNLMAQVTSPDAFIVSPPWTRIDAAQAKHLQLELAMDQGPHLVGVYWTREGESFSQRRSARFESSGDRGMHKHILDLSVHPEWRGEITSLRVDPVDVDPDDPARPLPQGEVWLSHVEALTQPPSEPLTPIIIAPDSQAPIDPPSTYDPLEVRGCATAPSAPIAPTRGLLALASLALVSLARRRAR